MTELRIVFAGQRASTAFGTAMRLQGAAVQSAVRGAAEDAADEIKARGAADIAGAGRFGGRWTQGLTADVSETGGGVQINVAHSVPYFGIFEHGGVIKGKPLLFIPTASFANQGGGKIRFRKDGKMPPVISVKQVTIPKKFHVHEIVQSIVKELGSLYRARRAA